MCLALHSTAQLSPCSEGSPSTAFSEKEPGVTVAREESYYPAVEAEKLCPPPQAKLSLLPKLTEDIFLDDAHAPLPNKRTHILVHP